jgi:hypothetical protein
MRERRDRAVLALVVGVGLLPFVAKPIHIDDPMYLWAAQQIAAMPLDFYGFEVNWYGFFEPMYAVNKNPPLVSVYLAGVGLLTGWSVIGLHLGMLLPALALVLGSYSLARCWCRSPLLAALAGWMTPVALVSATTLMSDVLMAALLVWALALWVRGIETGRTRTLVAACVLMGLCPLAKYFGSVALPLAIAYALAQQRGVGRWALYLAIPIAFVAAYQGIMLWRYDWNPLLDVGTYALAYDSKGRFTPLERGWVGLAFAGGGLATAGMFVPWLLGRRGALAAAVVGAAALAALPLVGSIGDLPLLDASGVRWGLVVQLVLFPGVGLGLLALAARDLSQRRDAAALTLALWVSGVWFFCSFTNWTPTARAVLPMAPAVGILLARALEDRRGEGSLDDLRLLRVPLLVGFGLSLAVAYGDTRLATTAEEAAAAIHARLRDVSGRVYFQGGWGFQHYMEARGATRIALDRTVLQPGDWVATPLRGSNLVQLPRDAVRDPQELAFPGSNWVATMSKSAGAGFYAALWGPLPYAFGPNPPERYVIQEITRPLALRR